RSLIGRADDDSCLLSDLGGPPNVERNGGAILAARTHGERERDRDDRDRKLDAHSQPPGQPLEPATRAVPRPAAEEDARTAPVFDGAAGTLCAVAEDGGFTSGLARAVMRRLDGRRLLPRELPRGLAAVLLELAGRARQVVRDPARGPRRRAG